MAKTTFVRKAILTFGIFASLSGLALAQCPINYVKLDNRSGKLTIKFQNASQQTITGIKFGVAYLDATGDPHDEPQPYTASLRLAPTRATSIDWPNTEVKQLYGFYDGVEVWLVKVAFADGTTWQPEPDKIRNQCFMTTRKR